MGGACVANRGQEKCIQDFCGETWGWRSHGRPSCLWGGDNIKMYVVEVGWQSVELGPSGSR